MKTFLCPCVYRSHYKANKLSIEYSFFKNDLFVYIRFCDVEDNALMDREERLMTKMVQRLTPPSLHTCMIMIC